MATTKYSAKQEAERIVNNYAVAAGTIGVVPHSCVALTPLQFKRCHDIARIFDVTNYTPETVLALVGTNVVGHATADTILSFIPVLGWGVKAATAGAVTKGVGKLLIEYFYDHSPLPSY